MRDREKETERRTDRMGEREKKSASINHSHAPVRVASGTKRNHMQLDNIPNLWLAGQVHSKVAFLLLKPSHDPLNPDPSPRRDRSPSICLTDTSPVKQAVTADIITL